MITSGYVNGMAEVVCLSGGSLFAAPNYAVLPNGEYERPYRVIPKDPNKAANYWQLLADHLKTTNDFVLFTYNTIYQGPPFLAMLKKYQLEKYVVVNTPPVRNPVYPTAGPKVAAIVLKGVKE